MNTLQIQVNPFTIFKDPSNQMDERVVKGIRANYSRRCCACFLGVYLITQNRKKIKAFEPYVTMDMVQGVPTIHDRGWEVQPDTGGSFTYGALVNNDPGAPATLPLDQERPGPGLDSAPYRSTDMKTD